MKSILYVDDEPTNLFVFQMVFKNIYKIYVAKSGKEGLDLVNQNPDIDLIITDMNMPLMDGMEFVNFVKAKNPFMPCIMLSGYHRTAEIENAIKNGLLVEYVTKPFDKSLLEQLIEKTITGTSVKN